MRRGRPPGSKGRPLSLSSNLREAGRLAVSARLPDAVLETLTGAEARRLRRGDADALTRARIATRPGLPLLGLERSEPRDLDAVAFLERLGNDSVVGAEESVDRTGSVGLGHARAIC